MIALFFFILLVPLKLLSTRIEELGQQELAWQTAETQARLRNEMMLFKKDLQPEEFAANYLRRRLTDIELEQRMAEVSYEESRSHRDRLFDEVFRSVESALSSGTDAVPSFFVVIADKNFKSFRYRIRDSLARLAGGEEAAAQFISFYTLRNQETRIDAETARRYSESAMKWGGSDSVSDGLHVRFRQILSSYVGRETKERQINVYYTDLHGFDRLLFWAQPIYDTERFYGSLMVGFLERELKLPAILQQALSSSRDGDIRRFAGWNKPESESTVLDTIFDQTVFGGRNLHVGVKLANAGENSLRRLMVALRMLAGAAMLLGFLLFMHTWLFGLQVKLKLRAKMAAVIAVVVFIPAFLVAVMARATLNDFMSSRSDMAQGYLTSRLDEIELGQEELLSRQSLRVLRFKSHIEQYWGEGLHKNPEPKLFADYLDFFVGRNFFYDRSGSTLHFRGDNLSGRADRLTFNNAVRLLSNLSGLQQSERTRKHLDNLAYTDAFVGEMNSLTKMSAAAAREGEIVSNLSSLNLLSRDIVALYADPGKRPVRPATIGFLKANPDGALARYVKTSPGYPVKYFQETSGDYHVKVAFARRDNEFVSQEFWLDPSIRRDMELKLLFDRAMDLKTSGSSVAEDSPEKVTGWRFRNNQPHIFVGAATFNPDNFTALFLDIVPYAVFIYSLVIMLVVSRVLAGLFLTPIEVVGLGVRSVAAGEDLTIRVHICNNDEFDRMGHAFNEMTAGLLQKRHISRFVSDRLLAEIASSHSTQQTREEVATVLASDLRNFTGISEKFSPEVVVEVLNDYFTAMEQAIKSEQGSIDKFIGDAIIAVFYPQEGANTSVRAARAACAMRRRLAEFNRAQQESGRFTVENGVGLATGRVVSFVAGSIGSRREFIVTGAPVERAEALEALSKQGVSSKVIVDTSSLAELQAVFSCQALDGQSDVYEIVEILA